MASDDLFLGQIALEMGLVTPDQLKEILGENERLRAQGQPRPLGQLLVDRKWVTAESLLPLFEELKRRTQGIPHLPRFEFRGRLGEGATAVVYRAWDRELKRHVAIKVLRGSAGLDETARHRFRREAAAAAGLAHPNLVEVYDAGESQGQLFIVMELVEGRPLSEILKEGKSEKEALVRILVKAAHGLAAAHGKGIIHRDLKPANILVSASGEPKVGDFGLAHVTESKTELTRTGTTLGTPLYMSPEQVEGRPKDISPRTDVYALGAILYEILTRRTPHLGETVAELYGKIVREEPKEPRKLDARIPRDLETIALKALHKNPGKRYESASEFAEDLRRALEGGPIGARPLSAADRIWRQAVRYRAILLPAAGSIALGLLIGVLASRKSQASRGLADSPRHAGDLRSALDGQPVPASEKPPSAIDSLDVREGLGLWLRSDSGIILGNGKSVSRWGDLSGKDRHAIQDTPGNQPAFVPNAVNGRPALLFNGYQWLCTSLPIDGLAGITLAVVSSSTQDLPSSGGSSYAVLCWKVRTGGYGQAYLCTLPSRVRVKLGTEKSDDHILQYPRPSSIGTDYTLTVARKDGPVLSLFINGAPVMSESGTFPKIALCEDELFIGKGTAGLFPGLIAEILVYEKALTDPERQLVERYLMNKYALPAK